MRKLSDTIARLAALQANHSTTGTLGSPDRLAALRGFGSNPGELDAKCYVPDVLPPNSPLVVVLHGCTQSAASYDHHSGWSRLADEAGFALLFPEQKRSNNSNLCFNWFDPRDVRRGSGEALSIREMIEAMVVAHGLDRSRIFVTGLSAGGAMAAAMLATYPDVFAGGAIIAGLPHGSAKTIPEAFDRMRGHGGPSDKELRSILRESSPHKGPWPRISIWHGTADRTVNTSNAAAIASQWLAVHDLTEGPEDSRTSGALSRQAWYDVHGISQVEVNTIAGMGHGVPLDVTTSGTAGPYMLDVGISSTNNIACFWGISSPQANNSKLSRNDTDQASSALQSSRRVQLELSTFTADHSPSTELGVRSIIEDALRTAGLMR